MTVMYITRASVLIFLVLALVGCGHSNPEMDASTTFYDQRQKSILIDRLNSEKIPHKVEGKRVWYPLEKAKSVQSILRELDKIQDIPFVFPDKTKSIQYLAALRQAGLQGAVFEEERGYVVYVPQDNAERAHEIFRSVVLDNN